MSKLLQDLAKLADLQNQIVIQAPSAGDRQLRVWQGLNYRMVKRYPQLAENTDGTLSQLEVDAMLAVAKRAKDLCASLQALRSVRRGSKHPETVALANLILS